MTEESVDVCERCAGRGLVEIRKCHPDCALRHAPDCPVITLTKCPSCARAEESERSLSD